MDKVNKAGPDQASKLSEFQYPSLAALVNCFVPFAFDSLLLGIKMNRKILNFTLLVLLLPAAAFAGEASEVLAAPKPLKLTHHVIGYLSVAITVLAYVAAMSEDVIELRKSKPMVLGSALVWFVISIYYALHGETKVAAVSFESNLLAYVELLLFILVSMTYLNARRNAAFSMDSGFGC